LVLVCFERKVQLTGCWWLVCSEEKSTAVWWLISQANRTHAGRHHVHAYFRHKSRHILLLPEAAVAKEEAEMHKRWPRRTICGTCR
jgi:hypothetical protein